MMLSLMFCTSRTELASFLYSNLLKDSSIFEQTMGRAVRSWWQYTAVLKSLTHSLPVNPNSNPAAQSRVQRPLHVFLRQQRRRTVDRVYTRLCQSHIWTLIESLDMITPTTELLYTAKRADHPMLFIAPPPPPARGLGKLPHLSTRILSTSRPRIKGPPRNNSVP
jgi:hypothetical protein